MLNRYMTAVQKHLYPLNRVVKVSQKASELLQDCRNAAAQFGAATEAKDIEAKYEIMQMRMADLADFISAMENYHGTPRDVLMKF